MNTGDTIAALATAPGRGGVAVVRMSGPDAWEMAGRVLGRPICDAQAGRFFFSRFGEADSGLVLVFKGPHSYTGEDVVEFHGHGGSVAPRRVLEACFAAGARLARRGEFTERAFLNGKLDLSAAEAVIDLVDARTDRAAADAQARLAGALSQRYESLYAEALELSGRLEHLLDVSEEEMPEGTMEAIAADIAQLRQRIDGLLATAHEGRILREGALVVLAGAPNAGKSSLMNALLGSRRAIVSDVAGTTRDTIEEGLDLDGWPVRLVDTAGLRETADVIEAEGVARAESQIAEADLVIALDCDVPGAIRIHAKCDLDEPAEATSSEAAPLRVSAKTGEGLAALRQRIADRLAALAAKGSEETGDVTARQASQLETAAQALAGVDVGDPVLAANALRQAAEAIGRIVGKTYSDDLLEELFSRFCVGK
jgi:tRNA modification GTPase